MVLITFPDWLEDNKEINKSETKEKNKLKIVAIQFTFSITSSFICFVFVEKIFAFEELISFNCVQ